MASNRNSNPEQPQPAPPPRPSKVENGRRSTGTTGAVKLSFVSLQKPHILSNTNTLDIPELTEEQKRLSEGGQIRVHVNEMEDIEAKSMDASTQVEDSNRKSSISSREAKRIRCAEKRKSRNSAGGKSEDQKDKRLSIGDREGSKKSLSNPSVQGGDKEKRKSSKISDTMKSVTRLSAGGASADKERKSSLKGKTSKEKSLSQVSDPEGRRVSLSEGAKKGSLGGESGSKRLSSLKKLLEMGSFIGPEDGDEESKLTSDMFEMSQDEGTGNSPTLSTEDSCASLDSEETLEIEKEEEDEDDEDAEEEAKEPAESGQRDTLLSETETISSFQFNFNQNLLRKSVDSEELTLKHGVHIPGEDKEDDIEFEKIEPFKTDSEIMEEMLKQVEHHTLIERETVVREALIVWDSISRYIIKKMKDGIGVRIPGLGTFTLATLPNDLRVGRNEEQDRFLQRRLRTFPVFKICPHIKQMNGLDEDSHLYQCNIPVVSMSHAAIALDSKLPRGLVEGIITETLVAFSRGVITSKDVEFPFPYIGKMYVKNKKVYMFFYRLFCGGLNFDFSHQMSMISSVILGSMTPLYYHRPTLEVKSVFHYEDMKSVGENLRSNVLPYAPGDLIRDDEEDRCNFMERLFAHSNLQYICSKCKDKYGDRCLDLEEGENEVEVEEEESITGGLDIRCEMSKNFERKEKRRCRYAIERCRQSFPFSFRQPDGSIFTPEPLYRPAKTGNAVLDRLAEDKCLLQQSLSCWIKREFLECLGTDDMAKHFDRDYFKRIKETRRKSALEAETALSERQATALSAESEETLEDQEIQRRSRESDFYKRLEACLLALEEPEPEIEEEEESSETLEAEEISEEEEMSDLGDKSEGRKSKIFNVFSGFFYNLLENDKQKKNESDYNLLSRTPSTTSTSSIASKVLTKTLSAGSSVSTPSSPACWEEHLQREPSLQPMNYIPPSPTKSTSEIATINIDNDDAEDTQAPDEAEASPDPANPKTD